MSINKFWNLKAFGLFGALYQFIPTVYLIILDIISTKFQKFNMLDVGVNTKIQCKTIIRYPMNITLGDKVHIGREVKMTSELSSSTLNINKGSQISEQCYLDFTGNLYIGEDCTISEQVMIQTHSHGLNPKDQPIPVPLKIQNNVWIGARVTILHNVNVIGENSIVGACSVVTKDIPSNVVVAGNPAKVIKNLNHKVGLSSKNLVV